MSKSPPPTSFGSFRAGAATVTVRSFPFSNRSPTSLNDSYYLFMPCMAEFGGPVNPNVALGGFEGDKYRSAKSIILTFIVNNHEDEAKNKKAEAWEKVFIEYMKNFKRHGPKDFNVSFTSERSIQDELNRESESDIKTIFASYMLMFLYISIALGRWESCEGKRIFVSMACSYVDNGNRGLVSERLKLVDRAK